MTATEHPAGPQTFGPDADRLAMLVAWLAEESGVIAEDVPVDLVWSWRHMPRQRALAVWIELVDWVEWLRHAYALTNLKGCWYRHSPVRHELLALMVAHRKAYRADSRPDDWRDDLTAWHTQWMVPCVSRVREHMSDCNMQRCSLSTSARTPLPLLRDESGGIEEFIADDLTDRLDTPIPAARQADSAAPQPTMTVEEMARAVNARLAEPIYPSDTDRALRYEGAIWEWEADTQLYRRQPPNS